MQKAKRLIGFLIKWLIIKPAKWLFNLFANLFIKLFGDTNLKATEREKRMIKAFLLSIFIAGTFYLPAQAIKNHIEYVKKLETIKLEVSTANAKQLAQPINTLPKNDNKATLQDERVTGGTIREITMYSSTPEQTDASPCIGANGQDICVLWRNGQNICATNAFPKGSELKIDKLGSCLVTDRMNARYSNRIDWYAGYDDECLDGVDAGDNCPNYERARKFGLQNLAVLLLK